MGYVKGANFEEKCFLVKGMREFSWGVIGTLTTSEEGDISFKFGNENIEGPRFKVGDIISVFGTIGEYNGNPQVIGSCHKVQVTKEILAKVVPVTPVDVQKEFAFLMDSAAAIRDPQLCPLTTGLLADYAEKLKTLPAGMAMHHSYLGGWVEHTAGILRAAIAIGSVYGERLNMDLLVSGAILHDIGKLLEFKTNELGLVEDYTFLGDGVGHATLGVGMIIARANVFDFDLNSPSVAALLNIVGTHAGSRDWGACADPICSEAVVISRLDYMDAHINSITSCTKELQCGEKSFNKSTRMPSYRTVVLPS